MSVVSVATLVIGVGVGLIVLIALVRTVRIVPQASTGLVERLGRYKRTLDPGLHFLVPFIDRLRPLVDMREQVVAFPPQPVITQDNVTISIDTVFYFTVTDAFRATYQVASLLFAIEQLTVTTLRNVIGSLSLEEALTSRDKINADLRIVLDEATERWGLRVNRIELKSIDPPGSIQEAMEKQMRAERERRAVIINAEGVKQAQITTAEGEKQAAILTAEGAKTAAILTAEGTRQSTILHAQGEAEATRQVFQAIHDGNPSPDLLTYQYIQNLPRVADGQAMKLMLIPSDAMATMGAVAALGGGFQTGQDAAAAPQGSPPGNP